MLIWVYGLLILLILFGSYWFSSFESVAESVVFIAAIALINVPPLLFVYGISRLLPDRPTDIIYLRAFRTDSTTGGIRTSLERVLDPQFRVSGIRDPKRRWPAFLRFMSYLLFLMKYLNPKYLNLEAGDEWKGRLWRSLGESKGAVIDIDDVTTAVEAEIRLCVKCMGLERILFVVRDTAAPEIWRDRIVDVLGGAVSRQRIRIAVWKLPAGEFEEEVAEFGRQLPEQPAGFAPEARALAEQLPGEVFRESNTRLWIEIGIGVSVSAVFSSALRYWFRESPTLVFFALPLPLIWYVLLWIHYVSFCRNSGSRRRRRIANLTILPLLLTPPAAALMIALLLPAIGQVQDAAAREKSKNNLKQIGVGMDIYDQSFDHLPAADAPYGDQPGKRGEYPVSWRVLLLPFIEQGNLYRKYRFDEPWDGPNNSLLLKEMPKTYRHPSANSPEGYTHYRVFASRPGLEPAAVFIDGLPTPKWSGTRGNRSSTILIVEAEEAVPWTKPEVLVFDPSQPLPKLGGQFKRGYNVVLADGSTRFLRNDVPEDKLRAWITGNGGEAVPDDK
jgi:hypothetical protein